MKKVQFKLPWTKRKCEGSCSSYAWRNCQREADLSCQKVSQCLWTFPIQLLSLLNTDWLCSAHRPSQTMEKMSAGSPRVLPSRLSNPRRVRTAFCQCSSEEGLGFLGIPGTNAHKTKTKQKPCLGREIGHYDLTVLAHVSLSLLFTTCC